MAPQIEVKKSESEIEPPAKQPVAGEAQRVLTLEEIARLTKDCTKPAETLMNVVALIARRFQTEVCSAYLLEPDRNHLVLAATVGLRPQSVGTLRMGIHEGLTGLVAELVMPCGRRASAKSPAIQVLQGSRRGRLPKLPGRAADRSRRSARRAGRADHSSLASSPRRKSVC